MEVKSFLAVYPKFLKMQRAKPCYEFFSRKSWESTWMERGRCERPENTCTKIYGCSSGGLRLQLMKWEPFVLYSLWVYQLEFSVDTCRCDASKGQC